MLKNQERNVQLQQQAYELEGNVIKAIFKNAEAIAFLHQTISSVRGNNFHRRLLQILGTEASVSEIEQLRTRAGLNESERHINKLLDLQLIELSQESHYKRTVKGETAVNALKGLENEIGREEGKKIFNSFLGINSIRFFLRVYGAKKEIDFIKKEIVFTPPEIGALALFLPRSIEGIAAVDKLNNAGLLIYREDGNIYLDPKKARSFYKYLRLLYDVVG